MYTSLELNVPIRLTALYSFFRHHFHADYSFRGEMHDFWEVVYVHTGKLGVTAGEQVYDLSAGELIIHPPVEFHNLFVNDPTGAEVIIFSFSAQTLSEDLFSGKVFRLDSIRQEIILRMFSYLETRMAQAPSYLRWLETVDPLSDERWFLPYMRLFEEDPHALTMASAFLTELLFSLADSEGRQRTITSGDAKLFRKAMDYLSTYVDQSVSVEELAKVLSISRSSLNRLFQKYAGVSVHRYCIMQKIKTATECLQSGLSVTETAERLGFSNQSYFSACYKRETGINPSEVRRSTM